MSVLFHCTTDVLTPFHKTWQMSCLVRLITHVTFVFKPCGIDWTATHSTDSANQGLDVNFIPIPRDSGDIDNWIPLR
jgi:hypothetical protein